MRYATNINFELKKLSKNEIKEIGVFISYTHKDKDLFSSFVNNLEEKGINVLSDLLIESGTANFHNKIHDMLVKATCAIILYNGTLTPWMLFEIGMIQGMEKNIYLYNVNDLEIPSYLSDVKVVKDFSEIEEIGKSNVLFSDIFENETTTLTKKDYLQFVINKLSYVYLRINIPGLREINTNAYSFKVIIVGLFKSDEIATEKTKEICHKNGALLEESYCSYYNTYKKCPYLSSDIPVNSSEVVLLNKVYQATSITGDVVEYLLPVNKEYGATFKCFMDIKDFALKERIIAILRDAGIISINDSGSGVTDRIYFSLPKRVMNGLFKINCVGGIENNFLCPGSLE